jgi:hypothetical protein
VTTRNAERPPFGRIQADENYATFFHGSPSQNYGARLWPILWRGDLDERRILVVATHSSGTKTTVIGYRHEIFECDKLHKDL